MNQQDRNHDMPTPSADDWPAGEEA